jgi:predicted MFS family arabinose efflux permease
MQEPGFDIRRAPARKATLEVGIPGCQPRAHRYDSRVPRRFSRFTVDIGPLKASRDFRLLWFGELISQTGSQVTTVALFVQVDAITHSAAAVGLIGLAQLVPMIVASVLIGPVIDRRDRRAVLMAAQVGLGLSSMILLLAAFSHHPALLVLYGAAAMNGGFVAVSMPTRAAMTPKLVPIEMLASAAAINQVMWNVAAIAGPALGGLIVARVGLTWAYGFDVATYGVAIVFVFCLRPTPATPAAAGEPEGWEAIKEGFSFLKGRRVLQSTFTVDLVAMIFGMPRALFPRLAVVQFHRGPEVVGLLFSALSVGALIGALTSGWVSSVRRPGRAILGAVAVWGLAVLGFGFSGRNLGLAFGFLAIAGAADVISAVFRSSSQQLIVPDALRGRLSALNILVVAGGARLGDFEAGIAGSLFSPFTAVVSGGALCLLGVGVIASRVPEFARWRTGDSA